MGGRGIFGNALSFVGIMRELDLGEIQRQLATSVRVLVTGTDPALAQQLAESVFGSGGMRSWSVALAGLDEAASGAEDQPDLVLLAVQRGEDPLTSVERARARARATPVPIVAVVLGPTADTVEQPADAPPRFELVAGSLDDPTGLARAVASAALDLVPDLALALGRRFPSLRPTVAERLIGETSRANGQFALVSSLPANLPLIGGFIGGAADMVVLTKNQGLLVYKLAGLHGRNLEDHVALAAEIAPVVGGAFFWRSVARTLIGLLPGIVGGLPKAAVAYAGTYAVGQMARYYYSTGRRPPPELIDRFQAEGARLAAEALKRLKEWRKTGDTRSEGDAGRPGRGDGEKE